MKRKLLVILILATAIVSCTNTSKQNLPPPPTSSALLTEPEVHQMSRQEVIEAIHDCQENNMRAVIVTTKHRVGRSYTDIVIEVTCRPRFLFK